MYVCICHAIRERDVQEAVGEGEMTMQGIYKRLGCRPRCGTCVSAMAETIAETVNGDTASRRD